MKPMFRGAAGIFPVVLLAILVLATAPVSAGLYRWIDDKGNVHYSDRVPPEHRDHARIEYSRDGMPVRRIKPAKTAEEFAEEQELERMRREQAQLIAEQQETDRVLLRAFPTEDDVLIARDGKLATVDISIGVIFNNLKRMKQNLVNMQQEVNEKLAQGEKVSPSYQSQMASMRQQVQDAYGRIVQEEERKLAIRDEYARYLQRYQELRNLEPQPGQYQVEEGEQPRLELDTVVACEDKNQCAQYWIKARAYLEEHAKTPIALSAESILMTATPRRSEDLSLTVSLIPQKESAGHWVFLDIQCYSTPIGDRLCDSEETWNIRRGFRSAVSGDAPAGAEIPPAETPPTPAPTASVEIR